MPDYSATYLRQIPPENWRPESMHTHRLAGDSSSAERERAFVAAYHSHVHRYLEWIMSTSSPSFPPALFGGYPHMPLGELTRRDYIHFISLIQWLGTNCGMAFLFEALRGCNYRLEYVPPPPPAPPPEPPPVARRRSRPLFLPAVESPVPPPVAPPWQPAGSGEGQSGRDHTGLCQADCENRGSQEPL